MSRSVIWPLNIVLFYLGIDFAKSIGSKRRIICLILRLKTLFIMVAFIPITLYLSVEQKEYNFGKSNDTVNLFGYSYHFKACIVLVSFVIFVHKSEQIESLVDDIERRLNDKEIRSMRRLSMVMSVSCVLATLANALAFTILPALELRAWSASVREGFWSTQVLIWHLSSHCFSIILCYGIRLIEKRTIKDILSADQHFKFKRRRSNYIDLQRNIMDIQRIKESVNDNLGILPLLWFTQAFFSTVLRLANLVINKYNMYEWQWSIHYFFEYSMIRIFDLTYFFAINYYQSQRPTSNQLMSIFDDMDYDSTNNLRLILLQNSVRCYAKFEYMVGNTFKMNRSFLFAFLSTVVTFTVMLIQLLESK